uniref:Uncharacterized protein n=1 Tax=candidate division WOR-3 bacterium TaxID=2052148 RepID=A0A7C4THG1_UNCW3
MILKLLILTSLLWGAGPIKDKRVEVEKRSYWGRTLTEEPPSHSFATPYFWNFETDSAFIRIPYYSITWQWGQPTSGPGSAYSGVNCWATNLAGNYENNCDYKLTMPTQNLSGATNPQLEFYHWYSTETSYDSGWVEVSTDNGNTWTKISQSYRGSSGGWIKANVSLFSFAGMNNLLIRFRFMSDGSVTYPGWYIDDVRIVNVSITSNVYASNFEGNNGDLTEVVINPGQSAPWQWGQPTSGPGSAYEGTRCWATNLSGSYNNNADAAIRNGTNLNLQNASYGEINFYQWYETEAGYDSGWVEVSTSGQNGPWTKVSQSFRGTSGNWLRTTVDISSYTNTNQFRFRFRFKSDGTVTYSGWYIDSVRVSIGSKTTLNFYDFEANNGGFTPDPPYSDISEWHCGTPTSGPNGAYSGTKCWATDLFGDYENNANWELLTPVCDLTGFNTASLQLAHWFSTESGYDFCIIEISSDGGSNWDTLRTFSGSSNGWRVDSMDITPYISTNFRAKFRFVSNSSVVNPGWYFDDVRIDTVGGYIGQDPIKLGTNTIAWYISNDATSDAGTYTAATEPEHPYGADITLLFGGGAHSPWSSYTTVRSYRTNTDYVTRSSGASTPSPFDTVSLVRFYTGAKFTDSRTLLQVWRVNNGQDNFEFKQKFTTQKWGDSSGLGISIILKNLANQSRQFSFRFEWDTHVGNYDSPYFRRYYSLTPNPWEPREIQWSGLGSLWYGEESEDSISTRRHFLSVTVPTFYNPPPTCPDSLFYVRWAGNYGGYSNAFEVPYMGDGIADSLPGYLDDCVCYMWVNRTIASNDSIVITQYLFSSSTLIDVEEQSSGFTRGGIALTFSNPIKNGTHLNFCSPKPDNISIMLYSIDGRRVAKIYEGRVQTGRTNFYFPDFDENGRSIPSGIYFLVLETKESRIIRKAVYLR